MSDRPELSDGPLLTNKERLALLVAQPHLPGLWGRYERTLRVMEAERDTLLRGEESFVGLVECVIEDGATELPSGEHVAATATRLIHQLRNERDEARALLERCVDYACVAPHDQDELHDGLMTNICAHLQGPGASKAGPEVGKPAEANSRPSPGPCKSIGRAE